jgi:DsbC/DsbD-like thiol-disulfide interchange protein
VHESVTPGGTTTIVVNFDIPKGWHIYWKDAGDAGSPTELTVKAPPRVKVSPVRYARPKVIQDPAGTVAGYEGSALLAFDITIDSTVATGRWVDLAIEGRWLVCKEACFMGKDRLHLRVRVDPGPGKIAPGATWLTQASMPRPAATLKATTTVDPTAVRLSWASSSTMWQFVPAYVPGVELEKPRFQAAQGRVEAIFAYRLSPRDTMGHAPRLRGLLMQGSKSTDPCWWVDVPLRTTAPAQDTPEKGEGDSP